MDARRKQVYTGIYKFENHQLVTVKEQWAAPMEELIEELNERGETVIFLGDGVPVFREMIKEKRKCRIPLHRLISINSAQQQWQHWE